LAPAQAPADNRIPPTPQSESAPLPKNTATVAGATAQPASGVDSVLPIDLPTALRIVDASNPTIALARERVQEAYERQRQAELVWLPNLETGPAYNRHDGQIQNSHGDIFPVSKSNLFMGGGAVLSLPTSEALFAPLIARRLTAAQAAAARAVTYHVQLDVALTYLDLLRVYGALAINADTLAKAEAMRQRAEVASRQGLSRSTADVTRARTETNLRQEERIDLEAQAAEVSARLAQLLLLQPTVDLRPADVAVVPVVLVPAGISLDELVATGLMNRPELAESRALVAAALARWRQARVGPLLPRLEVGYLAGTFGGGINDEFGQFASRVDGTAQAVWELRKLGFGDVAVARERRALYNEANFHVLEVQAQVGAEVTAAAKLARGHERALANAQIAVREALETWRRLDAASFGLANPREKLLNTLEPLIAIQTLSQARVQYLAQVIEFNKAQFRLYTAMGQPPIEALPQAVTLPLEVPVAPPSK
jgi:outer membrane protein TolC